MSAIQTGLELDARQCAMLEAMGIDLLGIVEQARALRPAPEPRASLAAPAQATVAPPDAPRKPPAPVVPPTPAVSADVSATASTPLSAAWLGVPQRLYGKDGGAAQGGGWLIVADLPPQSATHPAAADARRLLDNMLRALGLHKAGVPVHLACAHRAAAPTEDAQTFDDALVTMLPTLAPRVVLALGPVAAQHLLKRNAPIGKLRGTVQPLPDWPQARVIASYPLDYLLRNGADKAKAWFDLCAAADAFGAA